MERAKILSDVYYAAATLTVLFGFALLVVYLSKRLDDIVSAFEGLVAWTNENILRILAFFLLVSLAVTGLAEIGLI